MLDCMNQEENKMGSSGVVLGDSNSPRMEILADFVGQSCRWARLGLSLLSLR